MNRLTKAAVVALALTTTAVPLAAEAQSREYRQDRRDDRQDRRDDRRDRRDDRREPRQERRDDRRDYRNDRRDERRDDRRRDTRRDRWENNRDYRQSRWDPNNRDWWRGRADFRGYNGPRSGYWYAPGYGYRQVDQRYYGHSWQRGGYLPATYRQYYVSDPYFYGLPPAPRGYRYVHAGNDIVLIAVASGLIASVLAGVL